MMHVAVVIVGFRNAHDVAGCLAALERSTHTDFEVVVCENGGSQSYAALIAAIPSALPCGQSVRAVQAPRNLGYAGGVNLGMAAAPDADAWWVLNPDTEAEPQALAQLVARLRRGDVEAVGGVVYLPADRVQNYGGRWRALIARPVALGHGRPVAEPVEAAPVEAAQSYISGASMLISRRFLERVGPMREDYFLYVEEVEWCLRAREKGVQLGFAPEARVLHRAGSTTGSHDRSAAQPKTPVYLDERNKLLVTRDRFPLLLPLAAPALLLQLVAKYGRRGAWRQVGYALQGWAAGLMNRRGPPSWISVDSP
jgi:GT2 family glycosyltransferase